MVTSVTEGGTQKFPKHLRLLKHTDMTFIGKLFLNFSQKSSVLDE
jgi:hypothetical protein